MSKGGFVKDEGPEQVQLNEEGVDASDEGDGEKEVEISECDEEAGDKAELQHEHTGEGDNEAVLEARDAGKHCGDEECCTAL